MSSTVVALGVLGYVLLAGYSTVQVQNHDPDSRSPEQWAKAVAWVVVGLLSVGALLRVATAS